jgi:transcriptional regulator with XRE-family HTH domain
MSPEQCRAARALLGLSQKELQESADVTGKTLSDFESGKTKPYAQTLGRIEEALEAAGVEFIPENGGGPGVRIKKNG